jgi:hypothetical protein
MPLLFKQTKQIYYHIYTVAQRKQTLSILFGILTRNAYFLPNIDKNFLKKTPGRSPFGKDFYVIWGQRFSVLRVFSSNFFSVKFETFPSQNEGEFFVFIDV